MEARPDKDYDMVTCELEAAEALAGLGRRSGVLTAEITTETSFQDPVKAVHQCSKDTSNTVTCEDPVKAVQCSKDTPNTVTCGETAQTSGCQLKPVGKLKQCSNEAEKEARKLRRILANRESARQTIRRRQAMYLELTRKSADLSEENENLKREKELAVVKFNYLKDRNNVLKTHMMKIKKTERRDTQVEPKSSRAEISTAAAMNSPIFLCNQPSLVPYFWPSMVPSSDVFPVPCASHPDGMGSTQFLVPQRGTNQGQDNSMGSIIVLPIPWMLPFLPPAGMFPTGDRQNEASTTYQCSNTCSSDTLPREECNQFSLHQRAIPVGNINGAKFTFPPENIDQSGNVSPPARLNHAFSHTSATHTSTVSTPDHMTWSLSNKSRELHVSPRKPEDVFSATEARRRRKELRRLKSSNCYDTHLLKF